MPFFERLAEKARLFIIICDSNRELTMRSPLRRHHDNITRRTHNDDDPDWVEWHRHTGQRTDVIRSQAAIN
jgi:hypothetical protein